MLNQDLQGKLKENGSKISHKPVSISGIAYFQENYIAGEIISEYFKSKKITGFKIEEIVLQWEVKFNN